MAEHEKDRLGEKLKDVESAREDQWAHQRDQELLEKMRKRPPAAAGATLECPRCGKPLVAREHKGVAVMACPAGDGAWLDAPTLKSVLDPRK